MSEWSDLMEVAEVADELDTTRRRARQRQRHGVKGCCFE